jgi:hypothetical protein
MELFTLNGNFQPNKLVENYESLIWTERYSRHGDIEIKGGNIQELITLLPKESYVCLRDSTVPMIIEDYKIQKPLTAAPSITITGRSFETVLERRGSVKTAPPAARTAWNISAEKESDAAYKAMRVVLGDFPRYQDEVLVLPLENPAVSANDAIPEIDLILPADYSTGTTNSYEIKPGQLYNAVLELIDINHRGLKSVRPVPGESKVGVEIYNGADLTNEVAFDARFDQFVDATYLLSLRGSANVGYVYGTGLSKSVLKTAAAEPSGLSRRVLVLDLSSDAEVNSNETLNSRGLVELYKYNATALFDGETAIQVAAGYNKQYFLGDILKLVGEYGLSQNVRVAEFIRTSDATGERAYPTFQAVD